MSSLRERIAEALTDWVIKAAGGDPANPFMPRRDTVHANSLLRADVVLAVVQPELDARDARIGELLTALMERDDEIKRLKANRPGKARVMAVIDETIADLEEANEQQEQAEAERDRLREAAKQARDKADELIDEWGALDYLDGITSGAVIRDLEALVKPLTAFDQDQTP